MQIAVASPHLLRLAFVIFTGGVAGVLLQMGSPSGKDAVMGYAMHIGRVGALAVALGIGIAVASTPGMA